MNMQEWKEAFDTNPKEALNYLFLRGGCIDTDFTTSKMPKYAQIIGSFEATPEEERRAYIEKYDVHFCTWLNAELVNNTPRRRVLDLVYAIQCLWRVNLPISREWLHDNHATLLVHADRIEDKKHRGWIKESILIALAHTQGKGQKYEYLWLSLWKEGAKDARLLDLARLGITSMNYLSIFDRLDLLSLGFRWFASQLDYKNRRKDADFLAKEWTFVKVWIKTRGPDIYVSFCDVLKTEDKKLYDFLEKKGAL